MRNKLATCRYIVSWSVSLSHAIWKNIYFEINVPCVLLALLCLHRPLSVYIHIFCVFFYMYMKVCCFFIFFGPFSRHFISLYQWALSDNKKKRYINDLSYKFCSPFLYLHSFTFLRFILFFSDAFLCRQIKQSCFWTIYELKWLWFNWS